MSSNESSVFVQLGLTLGQIQATQAQHSTQMAQQLRLLEQLVRVLLAQRSTTGPTSPKTASTNSRPSLLGKVVQRTSERISTETLQKMLGKAFEWGVPYLLPGAVALWGLLRGLFRFLGGI